MQLLLWNAKSELFIQAVHLRAERQPLLNTKNSSSRLGTKLKEKVFKAINDRKPAIVRLITDYNERYSEYRLKFPNQLSSDDDEEGLLSYAKLSNMSLDDAFWNDGLFYHCNAPWAIDPKVREGISYIHAINRTREEFELIAQELARAMGWAMDLHSVDLLERGDSDVPVNDVDRVQLPNLKRIEKTWVIMKELCMRLASHRELVTEWSDNFLWVWDHCHPKENENQAFIDSWRKLIQHIRQTNVADLVDIDDADDALEDAVLEEVIEDGEEAEDNWMSDNDSNPDPAES
ncbi:hypothetical protein PCASD_15069 [Puccinia coronata f. sp. avenae]|uniref:Uncharacterized protein n=1 Tax=Puccinia coronata f. sp. avenae TaxID=200324 RepID=A0A2N5UAU3_9BASI|nr:hypothetical protein PCASD_15069 [Puccinia coronata f. sp. avenae]